MRKFIVVLVAVVFAVWAKAEVPVTDLEMNEVEKTVSFSVETGILNKYIGERSGQTYTDGPVIQSSMSVSVPWFDFTVWNSSSLERGSEKTTGDEIDYTISRSDEIGFVGVECGVSYYDFSKLCSGTENDAFAIYAELSTKALMDEILHAQMPILVGVVENYVRVEADITTPGSEFEGGTFVTFGTRGTFCKEYMIRAVADVSITRDDGVYGETADWICAGKMSVEADQWGWTFVPSLMCTAPFHGEKEMVVGFSVKTEF